MPDALIVVPSVSFAHDRIQFGQPVQDQAFQFRHLGDRHGFLSREPVQPGDHVAERVAQPPIRVRRALQDLRPDPLIDRIIRLSHPQPQDIRPYCCTTLSGAVMLPSDLDIFMPFSSSVNPCVSTA